MTQYANKLCLVDRYWQPLCIIIKVYLKYFQLS